MPEDTRAIIIEFVKKVGPVLPIQISKKLNIDLLFASAMLSELVARKQLKASKAGIGSSPIYFIPGQEYLLGPKLYSHLKSKEREAYDILREKKLIYEDEAEPWQRVAFSQLKDFAVPISVTMNDKTKVFWKFYLIGDEEAKNMISNILEPKKEERIKKLKPEQLKLEEGDKQQISELIEEKPELEEPKIELVQEAEIKQTIEEEQPKPAKKQTIRKKKEEDLTFYNSIKDYLIHRKIKILEEVATKKNKEYELLVEIPSALGGLKYFVKAKNKKSINDSEIILAHTQGQEKKVPCLLLTNGTLTKKAKELIEKKITGQFVFKQI